MTLIQTRGYRALTMSALAAQLGVSASALYNHVGSKRDIMILVQDRVNTEIDCNAFETEPWDVALDCWARSYRNVYARNIPLIPVMSVLPVADSPHTLVMYEKVSAGLVRGGWPESRVVNAVVAVESLVFGSAYDATAPENIFHPGQLSETAPVFSAAVAQRDLTVISPDGRRSAGSGADAAFDVALRSLIAGFRQELEALRPSKND
ncbi:TetR/AcrR family transcriptional regulator [Kocuria rhizophila]|nr:TetR/AcrR family transcriptional regulator [Kocuria rhizophila]MCT1456123.1 TetR/AcrR family transcriptional regulator [Kocuria rhizophila]MCT1879199.1 TetR/AcrR family transcriptional regulator [Kocuria rhizophila]